jgi:hypothetical protein
VNPFTRAHRSRFIGRRRDLYILRLPLSLENVPNVNMYANRDLRGWFHTFTSLPLVHTQNLDFLRWRLWLGFLLIPEASFMKVFTHQDLWTWNSLIFPKFVSSCLHEFIRFLKFADFPLIDFARFHLPSNSQPTCNPRSIRRSSRSMLEDSRIMQNQHYFFTNIFLLWRRLSALRHIHEHIHKFGTSTFWG